ncbi:MAG: peptidoglycan DD-metalloendopeptidase family protein, partial [Acutalibacteraceae bacterium]
IFNKLTKFVKNNRIKINRFCLFLALISLVITVAASGVTLGYTVKYSDDVIAVVSSAADYEKADAIVLENLKSTSNKCAIAKPRLGITITVSDKLCSTEKLVDLIVDNNDEIVRGTALFVNGKAVTCVEGDKLKEYVEEYRTRYYVKGAKNESEFVDKVCVKEGYFLKSDIDDIETAKWMIGQLQVKTVSISTNNVEVPFETKNVKTKEKPVGYSEVTTHGQNGIVRKTLQTETINGEVYQVAEIGSEVIKEQVPQVVTVGTAPKKEKVTIRVAATGFICPIGVGKFKISAYYGDGRNHKGIDLAADKGTAVFAASAGTVTYAGYDGNYGYSIIIDHGNGIQTRYAHASKLCVSKGATVSRGEMIAAVGSTGWSTGNHLHFEVIVNGNRVNPAPYIGLK